MSGSFSTPAVAGAAAGLSRLDAPAPARSALARAASAPVFIHSSWRTSSTWLWAKLRSAPTAIAYCEVFHERLASLTIEYLRRNDYSGWNSKHPEGAPYFLEFAPLVGPGGAARGYDRRMAVDWFVPLEGLGGPLRDAERTYLEGLIAAAAERGKVAVLTDTRTLGRFTAIAGAFPGVHVLLVRNLFHQWASYTEQWANGNGYFLDMLFATVEAAARADPFARLLADWFDVGERSPLNPATFQLFLLFHLYLTVHAHDAANLVVDVNQVAAEPERRAAVEAALAAAVGAPIDLADARAPFGLSLFAVPSRTAFVDTIEQFFKLAIDGSVSAEAVRFGARAKDEALLEWDRCEFYCGAQRARFGKAAPPALAPAPAPAPTTAGEAMRPKEKRRGRRR
ncbi:hypothetical protein DFR50_101249 [Roseiarcus fermentans]|uniref:Uncharacterized protein n=1 Tax=Roseiarcus fermentans TaxID=1473586 RepID=A0A366FX40_9HYPH|nr:hypothetical protein [Roseiarcus fermentans]RBP18305.1 hypothetical protein DFR50_101249 [Roseiarcus fermentans]